jgi:hypothetical protein
MAPFHFRHSPPHTVGQKPGPRTPSPSKRRSVMSSTPELGARRPMPRSTARSGFAALRPTSARRWPGWSRLTLDEDLDSIVGHVTEFAGRLRADMDSEEHHALGERGAP